MSKSHAPDANDHWKRLAAELGLEMDPEPAAPEAAPPPTKPAAIEHPEPVAEAVASESLGVWTTDSHEFVMARTSESEREPEVIAVESERSDAADDEFGSAPTEPPTDEKPQRRRRRSRRRKGDEAPAEAGVATDELGADDDLPGDIVKDWNIPSWNDLIASLYRPER